MCGLWPLRSSYASARAATAASHSGRPATQTVPPLPPPVILAPNSSCVGISCAAKVRMQAIGRFGRRGGRECLPDQPDEVIRPF